MCDDIEAKLVQIQETLRNENIDYPSLLEIINETRTDLSKKKSTLARLFNQQSQECTVRYWQSYNYGVDECDVDLIEQSTGLTAEALKQAELPDALSHLTCDNFEEEIELLQPQYNDARGTAEGDELLDLIGAIKTFSQSCVGWEIPPRYSTYEIYPVFYHPLTIDGEELALRYNHGRIIFKDKTNLGYFGYEDFSNVKDDILITDFVWPISGDFRFDLVLDLEKIAFEVGVSVDLVRFALPLGPGEESTY